MTTPDQVSDETSQPALWIDGLVAMPRILMLTDLSTLPRANFVEQLSDPKPGEAHERRWSGYRVIDVINLASPLLAAQYVRVGAGDYVVPLALTHIEQALLADTLDDQPITVAQGAPWRLTLPDKRRFINVKAVDHLELVTEPGENTALSILRARNRAQRAQNKADG